MLEHWSSPPPPPGGLETIGKEIFGEAKKKPKKTFLIF